MLALFTVAALFAATPVRHALAEPTTTVTSLAQAGEELDNQQVDFTGEVVGDIIDGENGYKWLDVTDGNASISVYVTDDEAAEVTNVGRYGQDGTELEVEGTFNLDCPEHDGLTDVHASKITVLSNGGSVSNPINWKYIIIGVILILVGAALTLLYRFLHDKSR
ncbi:MAG: hypothetical protein LBM21_03055 [Coriobacteriales bacterium]|jgi:hypothetical protein|nr:hypothetical protein [Coriobacteriales bacterium]